MPRPKRSKVAPSAPTTRIPGGLKLSKENNYSARFTKVQTDKSSSEGDGIVTNARTTKRRGDGKVREDAFMSGALPDPPKNSQPERNTKTSNGSKEEIVEETQTRPRGRRPEAPTRTEDKVPPVSTLVPREPAQSEVSQKDSSPENIEVPRSPVLPLAKTAEQSEQVPGSAWRSQATPRLESSILAFGGFKRRSRQPSILQIGRQDDSISLNSLGDLGGLGSDMSDDLEGFNFEGESRALHDGHQTPRSKVAEGSDHPNVSMHIASSPLPIRSSRKRKATPPEVLVPRSQSPPESDASIQSEEGLENVGLAALEQEDEDIELPPPKRHAGLRPDLFSDTMAPPRSSSPPRPQSPVNIPVKPTKTSKSNPQPKRKQTPRVTAPTSPRTRSRKPGPKSMSTATLQTLLPRRKAHHQEDDFDIPSSNGGQESSVIIPIEDDDELGFAAPVSRKSNNPPPTTKSKRTTNNPPSKPTSSRRGKFHLAKAVTTNPVTPATKKAAKNSTSHKPTSAPETYGRRQSDKENESEPSDSSNPSDESLFPSGLEEDSQIGGTSNIKTAAADHTAATKSKGTKELKSLAKKFKEVDQWDLDFEDMTGDSSPKDAR